MVGHGGLKGPRTCDQCQLVTSPSLPLPVQPASGGVLFCLGFSLAALPLVLRMMSWDRGKAELGRTCMHNLDDRYPCAMDPYII